MLCAPRLAAWLTVLAVVLAASAAAAQGLTPAEQEAFAALARAADAVERAGDRTALLIQTATRLATAAREALNAFDAADGERETAAAAYRAALRATQAGTVTCASYPCTNNRLEPFDGIGRALAEHLQRIAGVLFVTAVYVEMVGVTGAEEARERGGRVRQLAAAMGRVDAAEATDRWNALLDELREDVAAANALYDRAAAAAATDRRALFDDVHRMVEAVAAAATRTPGDFASRAVIGDVQDRLVALRARLSTVAQPAAADAADDEVVRVSDLATTGGGSSEEPETGATLEAGVTDALAALDRAFETQGAAQDDPPRPAEVGVADALAALDRAFETQGAAQDDPPGAPAALGRAETRAEAAEARAEAALARAEAAELRAEVALVRAETAEAELAARAGPQEPATAEWEQALGAAVRFGQPDRTSEGDLDDGSHYDQSSDDRSYSELCSGTPDRPVVTGFNLEIRSNTEAIHWRWKRRANQWWRAYFNRQFLGDVGERIVRVADTEVTWYEYRPLRNGEEGEFILLVACTSSGYDEVDVHYHH